ncbi:MAG: VOC family protein [Balneolaceae bacterium]
MFKHTRTFSSFSVDDIQKAKKIYSEKLGLEVREEGDMGLSLHLAGDTMIFIYPKSNHQPAEFTILNFAVDDIDAAMESLKNKGIRPYNITTTTCHRMRKVSSEASSEQRSRYCLVQRSGRECTIHTAEVIRTHRSKNIQKIIVRNWTNRLRK